VRIVAGRFRGRRIEAPEGLGVRPTGDRTREAVFNILTQGKLQWRAGKEGSGDHDGGNPLAGARVLDAFAGTGALGLEALSRGAGHVTFMEDQAAALAMCQRNIRNLDAEAACKLLSCDVLRPPRAQAPCDLVLMDPPYNQGLAPPALTALQAAGWIAPGTFAVVELMANEPFEAPANFEPVDERKYGKARVVFLRALD
jgi:16S rRNA (guanine966-N2)-methyltransferase